MEEPRRRYLRPRPDSWPAVRRCCRARMAQPSACDCPSRRRCWQRKRKLSLPKQGMVVALWVVVPELVVAWAAVLHLVPKPAESVVVVAAEPFSGNESPARVLVPS
uniref:(northern house mosquito) hypothetical protein n=1 Tax=Culex pipiens TaxID=7175 RepID=A0A8D8A7E7_CULPI